MARNQSILGVVAGLRLSVCSAAIFSAIGLAALATPRVAALNEWCPVMTEEKSDPAITTVYGGTTVAFCCDTCLKKFVANPARYEGRLPQFAESSTTAAGGRNEPGAHGHAPTDLQGGHEDNGQPELPVGTDQHGHDHASDASGEDREPLLGRLHPMLVHFPLAGLPLALMGFLVWVATGRKAFAQADVLPLFAATLASIAAVITGNIAHNSMRFSESLHVIVERHQFVSTTVMVLAICLSIIRLWRWNGLAGNWRWAYGGGLAIVCALLGYTGFLGGSLVFGPDHLAW